MSRSGEGVRPIHRNCANFSNGICMLTGMPVDPEGAACPNFTPKPVGVQPPARRPSGLRPPARPPIPPMAPPAYMAPPWPGYGLRRVPWRRYGYSGYPPRPYGMGMGWGRRGGYGAGYGMGYGGRGRGRMGGFAAGPGGFCVCPNCGYQAPHQPGVPCFQQRCPRCGAPMIRGG